MEMTWYWWLIFAIGPLLGLAGGIYGSWNTIRQTKGPRERAFAVRMSWLMFFVLTAWLVLLLITPQPYNWLWWIPYGIMLPLFIRHFNRRQQELREEEAMSMPPNPA